jgi:hypothetical protein
MPTSYRVVGLESIVIGALQSDYHMPTTLTTIAHIVPDSAKLIFENPESTKFYTEESDDVDVEIQGNTAKTIEFATADMGFANWILAFGGSTSGTAWSSPVTSTLLTQRAVRITTKDVNNAQFQIDIRNCSLRASGELAFSRTARGQFAFKGTVLKCGSTAPMVSRRI